MTGLGLIDVEKLEASTIVYDKSVERPGAERGKRILVTRELNCYLVWEFWTNADRDYDYGCTIAIKDGRESAIDWAVKYVGSIK